MINEDNVSYIRFTSRQIVDKAMHSLEGIVRGIALDNRVNDAELNALKGWINDHGEHGDLHPFNEVIDRIREIISDGIVDEEERADILWLCDKFTTEDRFYSVIASDMQRLQGMLGGIAADGNVSKEELQGLQQWMDEHEHLRSCWPYDEIESLITSVMKDGVIDEREQRMLVNFFSEFFDHEMHRAISCTEELEDIKITGVCALAPSIEFADKLFCFTGKSERLSRNELAAQIAGFGGKFTNGLTQKVDYLIVGADGNPCWAFSCYGRKVESAIVLRKKGSRLMIVHEYDYWDAVEDMR